MCGVLLLHKIHLDFCGLIVPYHPKCINLALFACCLFEGKLELAGGVNGAGETGKRGQRNGLYREKYYTELAEERQTTPGLRLKKLGITNKSETH